MLFLMSREEVETAFMRFGPAHIHRIPSEFTVRTAREINKAAEPFVIGSGFFPLAILPEFERSARNRPIASIFSSRCDVSHAHPTEKFTRAKSLHKRSVALWQ